MGVIMWEPLEKLFKDDVGKCGSFMFMGSRWINEIDGNIYLYKHINTRRYINISEDSKHFFVYASVMNDYLPIDKDTAINHVYN